MDAGGTDHRPVTGDFGWALAWSPGGSHLAYTTTCDGRSEVWVVDLASSESWLLAQGAHNPAWSPAPRTVTGPSRSRRMDGSIPCPTFPWVCLGTGQWSAASGQRYLSRQGAMGTGVHQQSRLDGDIVTGVSRRPDRSRSRRLTGRRMVYFGVCRNRLPSRSPSGLGTLSASSLIVRVSPSTHRSQSWCDGSVVVSSVLSSQAPHSMLPTKRCSMRLRAMSLMRAGDVVRCDLGTPSRGEPGFVRPAIVVTSR